MFNVMASRNERFSRASRSSRANSGKPQVGGVSMGSSGDTELDDEDDEPWADAEVDEEGSTMSPFLVAMLWKMQRLMYVVYTLAGSSTHQAVAMVVVGLCNVVLVGAFYAALTTSFEEFPDGSTVPEAIWTAWLWMADPGQHSEVEGWWNRMIATYETLFGILFFSIVVGLVVEVVKDKMEMLRKGKTAVVEINHTIMLGWTDKSLHFIKELILANASEGGGVIAVLSEAEKDFVEGEVAHHFKKGQMLGTKVIVRHGSRLHTPDLIKMSFQTCKSVVVLSNSREDPSKADSEIMQVVLNLVNLECSGHIVVEVRDMDNEPLVKLIGHRHVETLVSHDIVGRLMLMSVRQPGLANVYAEVLGFNGAEFYTEHWPQLVGKCFDDLQACFPDAVPIGVHTDDGILLNPPHNYILGETDDLIVFAEDNDSYAPMDPVELDFREWTVDKPKPQKELILFCGWRRDLRDIILMLEPLVQPNTELHIMCNMGREERDTLLAEGGLDVSQLSNLQIRHLVGNPCIRRHLEEAPVEEYTSVLILSDESRETEIMQSDSACLATLVLIRAIQVKRLEDRSEDKTVKPPRPTPGPVRVLQDSSVRKHKNSNSFTGLITLTGRTNSAHSPNVVRTPSNESTNFWEVLKKKRVPIVCEILDPRTQRTISGHDRFAMVCDFLQSNDMVAKILAMMSEDIGVKAILQELLQPHGAQLEVVSSGLYVGKNELLSFYQVASRVRSVQETLVGYFETGPIPKAKPGESHGPRCLINPAHKDVVRSWDGVNLVMISQSHVNAYTPGGVSCASPNEGRSPQESMHRGSSMVDLRRSTVFSRSRRGMLDGNFADQGPAYRREKSKLDNSLVSIIKEKRRRASTARANVDDQLDGFWASSNSTHTSNIPDAIAYIHNKEIAKQWRQRGAKHQVPDPLPAVASRHETDTSGLSEGSTFAKSAQGSEPKHVRRSWNGSANPQPIPNSAPITSVMGADQAVERIVKAFSSLSAESRDCLVAMAEQMVKSK